MSSRSHASPKRPGGKREGHSKYVGVTWHRQDQKWQAAIKIEGKSMHLGHFLDEDEAARKYDEYASKLGRNVNFPDEVNAQSERQQNGNLLGQAKKGVCSSSRTSKLSSSSSSSSSSSHRNASHKSKGNRSHKSQGGDKKSEFIGVTWNRRAEKVG
jgi:hypothetical protein